MQQPILDGILESPLDLNGYGFVNIGGLLGTFEVPLTFSAPLIRTGDIISIPVATGSVNGYLTSTDWTTFNSKQSALGFTPAPIASPAFTGIPLAPTASADTNTGQIATTAFVVNALATAITGLLSFKGLTDCSGNPNYPAASKGDTYIVSVAGKIGGGAGTVVDVGDLYIAEANNAGGTEAAVGASWAHLEHSLAGALLASNNLSDLTSVGAARTNLGLGTLALQSGTFSGTSSGTNTGDQTLPTIAATSTILKGDGAGPAASAGSPRPSRITAYGLVYAGSTVALSSTSTNATTTRKFLAQSGNGTTPTAPTWQTLTAGDIPDLSAVYEPFSSNLTSWAAITRAAGFDTFTTTPSIANFKNLLTNETTVVGNLLSLANPSAISFIKIAADNTVSTRTPSQLLGDIAAEPALGNPGTTGFVLFSTTGGVRSWATPIAGIDSDGNSIHLNPSGANLANIVISNPLAYSRLVYDTTYVSVENGRINFVAADPPTGQGFRFNTYNVKFGTGGTVQYQDGVLDFATFSSIIDRIGSANLPLGAQLYDNAGTPKLAVDFGARYLYRSDGIGVAFDWDSGHLTASVYGDIYSDDNFSSVCISTEVRQLIANDGSSVSLDWSDPSILTIAGVIPISSNGILDGNLADNIKVLDRQLIANDGSTVALDWSNPDEIDFFGGIVSILPTGQVSADFLVGDGSGIINVTPKVGSIGSVIAGTKTATGTATTTFTVTIGVTMANTTYKVTTEGDNALSSAVHYVNNKTTTTFDIVYVAGLTGSVAIDWIVSP